MGEVSGARGCHAAPLVGSPAARLRDDTARKLASGLIRRCPHPQEPAFWYLSAGMLTCAACTAQAAQAVGAAPATCSACGAPADAIAAWVADGVPCLAHLCGTCRDSGLVPLTPN